jgi:hypothetical protein
MTNIVFRRTVGGSQVMGIPRIDGTAKRKGKQAAVRDFVEHVAICVVGLEHTVCPAPELMFERNDHPIVVGHSIRTDLGHSTKSRVIARRHWWACTGRCWQCAEANAFAFGFWTLQKPVLIRSEKVRNVP